MVESILFGPYIPALFLNFSRQEFIQSKNAPIKFQFVYFPEKKYMYTYIPSGMNGTKMQLSSASTYGA